MVIVCTGCKNQITLDEATLPTGTFKIRCTGCGKIITSQRDADPPPAIPPQVTSAPPAPEPSPAPPPTAGPVRNTATPNKGLTPELEDYVKTQIDTAKREILEAMQILLKGGTLSSQESMSERTKNTALICCSEPSTSQFVESVLKSLGYKPDVTYSAADSFKQLDSYYPMIVIDPLFPDDQEGGKKLITRINSRKAADRREMFVVLVSSNQKTLDGNAAFFHGVNLIVNKAELNTLESSIRRCQKDFQQLYSTFRLVSQKE